MIPKKIHYIRLSKDGPISDYDQYCINTTQINNKDFQVKVWSEEDIPNNNLSDNELKNFMCFYVLHKEGGFVINNNIIVLQKIPNEWLQYKLFCSLEHEWKLSSHILGGRKSGRFFREGLNQLIENNFKGIDSLINQIFGRYSLILLENGKYLSSDTVNFIETPLIYPHTTPIGIDNSNMILGRYWDNYSTNKDITLDVIEI